jgi:PIN domain nuclease of toxin-antitoxin system
MIVLDTHTWVWWVSGTPGLSRQAAAAIERAVAGDGIHVSSMSTWEVAMLVKAGRLELSMDVDDWVARSESLPFLNFVPVSNRIAIRSTRLADYPHKDPADRIIVATALSLGVPLVTRDRRLRDYPHLETVW